jgi:hypothetical protein
LSIIMRGSDLRVVLAATALALSAGCGTRALDASRGSSGLGNIGGSGTGAGGTTGMPFKPTRQVDILFVIDNAASAVELQRNLVSNFPTFMTTLGSAPAGPPELHIAVITPDMGAGDGSIAGCSAQEGDAGLFQWARGGCVAAGLAPNTTFISNDNGVANYTGRIEDVFACIAAVGSSGCGFQQPFAAIARAFGTDGRVAPDESMGFLRPEAFLMIVIVMGADDCSVPPGSILFDTKSNTTLASQLGPVGTFRCNEFGHLCNGAKPPRLAPNGSAGDAVTLDNCHSAEDAGMLTPIATFLSQIRGLKAYPDQQILVAAITGPVAPYRVLWRDASPPDPSGPWPWIGPSCTSTSVIADPAVRINDWATRFGANGTVLSVCDDNFGPALDALATKIVQQLPPPVPLP